MTVICKVQYLVLEGKFWLMSLSVGSASSGVAYTVSMTVIYQVPYLVLEGKFWLMSLSVGRASSGVAYTVSMTVIYQVPYLVLEGKFWLMSLSVGRASSGVADSTCWAACRLRSETRRIKLSVWFIKLCFLQYLDPIGERLLAWVIVGIHNHT